MERSAWRGTAGRALQPVADCFLLTMTLASFLFLVTPGISLVERIGPGPGLGWWILAFAVSGTNLVKWRTLGAWRKVLSCVLCAWAFIQAQFVLSLLLGPRIAPDYEQILYALTVLATVLGWTGITLLALAAWILKRLVGSVVRRCRRAGAPGASGRGGGAGDAALSARLGWLAFLLSVGRAMADVLFAVEPSLRMGGVPAGLIPLSLSNALLPLTAATFILLLGLLDSYVREPSAAPPGPSPGHAAAATD